MRNLDNRIKKLERKMNSLRKLEERLNKLSFIEINIKDTDEKLRFPFSYK